MHPRRTRNPWITYSKLLETSQLRLFCFPFAGGGAATYRSWYERLAPRVEVMPVELPGRASRFQEKPFRQLEPLLESLAAGLAPELDRPFAFFGHSMGALIAFELTRWLRRSGGPLPQRLFVSARRAPQLPPREDEVYYDLPEADFVAKLRELNGTPEEVLEHPELMNMMIPLLRADFELNETYRYTPAAPFELPITALGGVADLEVPREDLTAWSEHTVGSFQLRMFEGDHFFINHAGEQLPHRILQDLAPLLV